MMNKEKKMEIEDLINNVVDQDFSKAAPTFAEIMKSKMDDALEQEKISIADQIFNGAEPVEDDEYIDDDPDDEDIDAALADDAEEYEDDAEEYEDEEV